MKIFNYFLSGLMLLLLCACSSNEKNFDDPEKAYNYAEEFVKKERFDEAIKRFQEVKNKFPYSRFAVLAELAIADTYFKQESFAEAQISYQSFRDLHPKNSQIDYVIFKIGLSYFEQLPSTVDRDIILANNAVSSFQEVIEGYPQSVHVKEATEKKQKSVLMLAQKELYIADFYFKKKQFESALGRYEDFLSKYPSLEDQERILSNAGISASKIGNSDKAKDFLSQLKNRFPQSRLISDLQKGISP